MLASCSSTWALLARPGAGSFPLAMVRGQRNVPSSGASVYGRLRSLRVEEFGVATGGGVWVAAGEYGKGNVLSYTLVDE